MKRRSFFQRIFGGLSAMVVAPFMRTPPALTYEEKVDEWYNSLAPITLGPSNVPFECDELQAFSAGMAAARVRPVFTRPPQGALTDAEYGNVFDRMSEAYYRKF